MVSKALFLKEMRDSRWIMIVGLAIAGLTGVSLPFLFDYLASLMTGVALPEWVQSAAAQQMADYRIYIWSNWYGKNMPQYALIVAVILGAAALAGERGRGSLEFTLTRPLSRKVVFLTKVAAGALVLTIVALGGSVATLLGGLVAGRTVSPCWFLGGVPALVAGSLALHALTMTFSARMTDAVKAGVAGIVIALALTVPSYIPSLAPYSLFYHMASGRAVLESGLGAVAAAGWSIAILGTAAVVLYYAAYRLFVTVDL